ncbi:multicopper oxidase domain-containing protein [Aetokthonos hydrillicola Thurmond2011]|uniref:Multicopper oxidase domain-containing protein n=1 Tax=Aetokthonos hydrillicola Thurmond2011 TaxID=2712845 RepID=A0AAP5M5V7_9CYAN|nr:multicopper oxidase domain-containing protein [Aetokthonos hydrillicola]MBO3459399.1 multicopper oxidase domain-containing protein [Aetokthonos hydrillicola CCALA 1050]MBW4586545.1 multicopper oxidase domain-containing protein [Aetokthonos hydrillicola CCALA 1050]MDR9893510.1 multicopper oxidase domain-containing protein [Aetokthonos hydrillicola Thurmond2011]
MLTRRQFVMATAGAGLTFLGSSILKANRTSAESPQITKFTEPLPVPFAGSPPSTLTITRNSYSFHSNLGEGPTLGYGGSRILGPTIEATRGTPLSINVVNNIVGGHPLLSAIDTELHGVQESDKTNPRVSLHLHGSNTEPKSDGYPEDTFTPGQSYVYNFNNNQEAATLWYHDHALGITGLNVLAGLAGFYLLRDVDDPAGGKGPLGLPAGAPYEVPLVLQDRLLNADGSIFHPSQPPWVIEYVADVATVNGKAWPNLNVDRTLYRFRIINGSSARTYNLKLSSKQPIIQIGTDQGLLNSPVYLSSLLMGPGERADILIDFSSSLPGDKIILQNDAVSPYPYGRANALLNNPQVPEMMQFTVNAGAPNPKPIPQILRLHKPLIKPVAVEPVRQRFLTLVELDPTPNALPVVLLLNYVYWDEALKNPELMERPKVDTVEQWNIINLQPVAHPMHLHLVPFQILNRQKINAAQYLKAYLANGSRKVIIDHTAGGSTVPASYPPPDPTPYLIGPATPPAPNEAGWKDTVLVNPYEIIRLIVPFGAQAAENLPFGNSFTGTYVWHCHMLGHEDNEMMLPYEVVS